jgi:glycine dehydrogenase subunit 1
MPFIPNTDADRREMLAAIGVQSFEELIAAVPAELRWQGTPSLPPGCSEMEVARELEGLAGQNATGSDAVSFLGAGAYDHFIPGAIAELLSRSEFYTAYTPYQAEVSQGTLTAIFEFQTLICQLTGMEVANASVYDGASGLGEAALMAHAVTGRRELVVAETVNPLYRRVLGTYTAGLGMVIREVPCPEGQVDPVALARLTGQKTAAVLIQHPNFLGILEPQDEIVRVVQEAGALAVVSADPVSLGVLKPPGEAGADIAVGEGQPLGIPQGFGGPLLGFLACRQELLRRMPGRLVGETTDAQGRRGFVLTLQTREQHIRREKATSNICTNHALCALAATMYLSLMGRGGVRGVAELCLQKSHYARDRICQISGFHPAFEKPFFREFVIRTPVPPGEVVAGLSARGLLAGVDLSGFGLGLDLDDGLLVAVTEKRTRGEIDRLVRELETFSAEASSRP